MSMIGRRAAPTKLNASDISDNAITSAHIQADALTHGDLAPNSITASELADNAVDTAAIAADAVDGTKIADNAIDSEHIAADSIDAEHYAAGSVDATAIANDAIDSQHYAADSIDAEHYAAGSVDGTAIANDAVDSQHIAADSIDAEHYAVGSVDGTAIAADAVDGTKIADDSINSEHIAADSIDAEHYAAGSVDSTAIAANAVTDTELNSAKLNGIETSATADQTASELLTAIKTVDGGSSGLDAQYVSGVDATNLGYNAKNWSSTYTWTGSFQTGSGGVVYELCTHSTGFWGSGYVEFELMDYYYDTRATKNSRYLLRSHAHVQYGPSSNITQIFGTADQAPYASAGPVYPSGVIGYYTFSISLPSYQGIRFRLRASSVQIVSSKGECYGGGKICVHSGGRI